MCQCVQLLIFDKQSYLFICLRTLLITVEMYSSEGYFIYEFLFMCIFIYFIVYSSYSKFVYEFMFLMHLVMDHMYEFVMSLNIHQVFGVSLEE